MGLSRIAFAVVASRVLSIRPRHFQMQFPTPGRETGFDRVRERSRSSVEGRLLRGAPMVIDARSALPSEVDTGRQPLAV